MATRSGSGEEGAKVHTKKMCQWTLGLQMQLYILLPETVCAWTIYLRVHMHSSSKMKLEHSHILRFVLVLVRGQCSSGHVMLWYILFSNWSNQFDWQFNMYGSCKRPFHGYEPKGTLHNLFDWRSNLDRPVRMKKNVPDPSLEITTLDFEGSSVLSPFACRDPCENLDLVSLETLILGVSFE